MERALRVISASLVIFMISISLIGCKAGEDNLTGIVESDKDVDVSKNEQQKDSMEDKTKEETKSDVPNYLNLDGFPIVKEPITFSVMTHKTEVQPPWNEIYVWKEYEKMTGIKIEWDHVAGADRTEKRNLALASGEYPDIFYRMSVPDNDLVKYGEQGIFLELNDLINDYGPNLKKVMETLPGVKESLPEYNDKIYAYPSLFDSEPIEIDTKMFINKEWLDKVGKDMPTTTDELYEVFKAFREDDANGNGEKDEIPFTASSLSYMLKTFKGAWGLGNRGSFHGDYVDFDEEKEELRFIPISDKYKEMLEYLNKLYTEELIDQEIFTMDSSQVTAKADEDLVGSFSYPNNNPAGVQNKEKFIGITTAFKGPHGDELWAPKRSKLGVKGAFVITDKCKYPEAAVRWIDYFYSDEGIKFFYMGKEGETFEKKEDGRYDFLDEILEDVERLSSFSAAVAKYVPYGGGNNPTIVKTEYFAGGETEPIPLEAANNMSPYSPKEVWGKFVYTPEEIEKFTPVQMDIHDYVNQMVPQFIQGKLSFSEWDSYVEQINRMGLDTYMEIYQKGYERYLDRNKQ